MTTMTLPYRLFLMFALGAACLAGCLPRYEQDYQLLKSEQEKIVIQENTPARCIDGIDNDRNGFTDCEDSKCSILPVCSSVKVETPAVTFVDIDDKLFFDVVICTSNN